MPCSVVVTLSSVFSKSLSRLILGTMENFSTSLVAPYHLAIRHGWTYTTRLPEKSPPQGALINNRHDYLIQKDKNRIVNSTKRRFCPDYQPRVCKWHHPSVMLKSLCRALQGKLFVAPKPRKTLKTVSSKNRITRPTEHVQTRSKT